MSRISDNAGDGGHQALHDKFASDIEHLKQSFGKLRHDVNGIVTSAVGVGKTGVSTVKDKASSAVGTVKEKASHAVDTVTDGLSGIKDKTGECCQAVEQSISDHPLTSAMIAFGLGFIVAKWLSRK